MAKDTVTVTRDGWGVSYTSGSGIQGCVLSVYKHYPDLPNKFGGRGIFRHGDHHGKIFPTKEAASKFALDHGYLQIYVRGPACPKCRVVHRSRFGENHSRSSFCPIHKEFIH